MALGPVEFAAATPERGVCAEMLAAGVGTTMFCPSRYAYVYVIDVSLRSQSCSHSPLLSGRALDEYKERTHDRYDHVVRRYRCRTANGEPADVVTRSLQRGHGEVLRDVKVVDGLVGRERGHG